MVRYWTPHARTLTFISLSHSLNHPTVHIHLSNEKISIEALFSARVDKLHPSISHISIHPYMTSPAVRFLLFLLNLVCLVCACLPACFSKFMLYIRRHKPTMSVRLLCFVLYAISYLIVPSQYISSSFICPIVVLFIMRGVYGETLTLEPKRECVCQP